MKNFQLKNREAGFGPASNRLAETFSLIGSLSSHQQANAVNAAFYSEFKIRQSKRSCMVFFVATRGAPLSTSNVVQPGQAYSW